MSVFSKADVDAVLATLPEELRTPNSVACSMYVESTTKKVIPAEEAKRELRRLGKEIGGC